MIQKEVGIKDSTIKDLYDLFRFSDLRVVYCANDALGTSGPFKEVKVDEILKIINGDFIDKDMPEENLEGIDILKTGEWE